MVSVYADRVKETTTTTGTGTLTLAGAVTGFQAFTTALTTGQVVTFCIEDGTNWEVSEGAFTTSGTTLARTRVIASSNAGALVSFAAGSKNVFLTLSARDVNPQLGAVNGQNGTTGCLASTYDRVDAASAIASLGNPVSGTLRLIGIRLPRGLPITNISFWAGSTGATTPTHQWFVLTDSALKVLAVTADDTTTAWAALAKKTLAVTSGPFVTTYAGLHYVGIMVTASTMPTAEGVSTLASGSRAAAPVASGNSNTGLTTPIAVGTTCTALAATGPVNYAELS